jgi:hypothetical protein
MIKTFALTPTAQEILLDEVYSYYHFRNDSTETAYIGETSAVSAGSDDVLSIPASTSAFICKNETLYAIGNGDLLVYGTNTDTSPFKSAGKGGGGGGGTDDYSQLANKPQIEGVTLSGNKTFEQLGISALSTTEIYNALK